MKRYFSRFDSLMPLTWERKGGGEKERWDKNEADRRNKREEKEKREREREREGEWVKMGFYFLHIGALKVKSKKSNKPILTHSLIDKRP
jgi:hypothetical protein